MEQDSSGNSRAIPESLVKALARPDSYGGLAGAKDDHVEEIQTHLSHVFLVGERVVKLHKAVRLTFVDFEAREARNQDALCELRLGQRLSPDVYLGLASVRLEGGRLVVGPLCDQPDPEAENVLVMRRLPEGQDALSRLEAGALERADLVAVADRIADLHLQEAGKSVGPKTREEEFVRVSTPMWDNVSALEGELGIAKVATLRERLGVRLGCLDSVVEQRRKQGRFVDGHGDLHLQHVWFEAGAVTLIDGLAFSDRLRLGDPAAEVAFLAMDLRYRSRSDLAEAFLARYAERTEDYGLYDIVDLYVSHRAAIRAKVAVLASRDAAIPADQRRRSHESAERHLALAEEALLSPPSGLCVVMCGTIGSGKSTVAAALAEELDAVLIRSDRVRREVAGFRPATGGTPDQGAYTLAAREGVYAEMLERARAPLCAGRNVVLDASFDRRDMREDAWAFAKDHAASPFLVEVRANRATTKARLETRSREGKDLSEAGPELLDLSLSRFEPPREWPADRQQRVATDDDDWTLVVEGLATRIERRGKHSSASDERKEHRMEWRSFFESELEKLQQLRDELEVQVELGGMEAKDRWRELDKRWSHLEGQARRIRETAQEDAEEIAETAKELARELREGFEHLRQQL